MTVQRGNAASVLETECKGEHVTSERDTGSISFNFSSPAKAPENVRKCPEVFAKTLYSSGFVMVSFHYTNLKNTQVI